MAASIDDHLKEPANRCLLILLGDRPLDEDDCVQTLALYGSIKRIQMASNCRVAFMDFECEHAPLLVALCFGFHQFKPDVPMPKGLKVLLPGCSVNNFLFLHSVPHALSTEAIRSYFHQETRRDVIVHRPGDAASPSCRVVVELNGPAADVHKNQMRLVHVVESGTSYNFYAIPNLEQLMNNKRVCEGESCEGCNVIELRAHVEFETREMEKRERALRENRATPGRADYSTAREAVPSPAPVLPSGQVRGEYGEPPPRVLISPNSFDRLRMRWGRVYQAPPRLSFVAGPQQQFPERREGKRQEADSKTDSGPADADFSQRETMKDRDSDDLLSGEEDKYVASGKAVRWSFSGESRVPSVPSPSHAVDEKEAYGIAPSPTAPVENEDTVPSPVARIVSDEDTTCHDTVSESSTISSESSDAIVEEGGRGRFFVEPDEWDEEDLLRHGHKVRLTTIDEESKEEDTTPSSEFLSQEVFETEEESGEEQEADKAEDGQEMEKAGGKMELEEQQDAAFLATALLPMRRTEVDSDDEVETEVEEGEGKREEKEEEQRVALSSTDSSPSLANEKIVMDSDDEEEKEEKMESDVEEVTRTEGMEETGEKMDVDEEGVKKEEEKEEEQQATPNAASSIVGSDALISKDTVEGMEVKQRDAAFLATALLPMRRTELDSDDEVETEVEEGEGKREEKEQEQRVALSAIDSSPSLADEKIVMDSDDEEEKEEKMDSDVEEVTDTEGMKENGEKVEVDEEGVKEEGQKVALLSSTATLDAGTHDQSLEKMEPMQRDTVASATLTRRLLIPTGLDSDDEVEEEMEQGGKSGEKEEEQKVSVLSSTPTTTLDAGTNDKSEEKLEVSLRDKVSPARRLLFPTGLDSDDEEVPEKHEEDGEKKEELKDAVPPVSIPRLWLRRTEVDSDDEEVEEGDEKELKEQKGGSRGDSPTLIASLGIETSEEREETADVVKEEQREDIVASPSPMRRWSRASALHEEEREEQGRCRSSASEYHEWLTREDDGISARDSLNCRSSDSDGEIVPLPSSLPTSTWGKGIVLEEKTTVDATVLSEQKGLLPGRAERMPASLPKGRTAIRRVAPTFGGPKPTVPKSTK